MRRILFALAIFLQAGGGQPVDIPIQNPDFSQVTALQYPAPDQCGSYRWGGNANGWNFGPSTGFFVPANPNPCGIPIPPAGSNYAYAGSGGTFSQDLGVSPASLQEYKPGYVTPGFYTLTFFVTNKIPSYPGYFTAELDYGTQELCEISGWPTNILTQIHMVCPSPGYLIIDHELPSNGPSQGSKNFVLHFSSSAQAGWPVLATNFSLTFTPQS